MERVQLQILRLKGRAVQFEERFARDCGGALIANQQHARSVVEFIRADAAKFAKIIKATGAKIE
jgi:hypothetical protein